MTENNNDLFNPDYERFIQAISKEPEFAGADYQPERDKQRLSKRLRALFDLMKDGTARSLREITEHIGGSEAGNSALLRDLRKPQFGGYEVERHYVAKGLYRYRLDVNAYDPETYEYIRRVRILEWNCSRVIKAHKAFLELMQTFPERAAEVAKKYNDSNASVFGIQLMTNSYTATTFAKMLDCKLAKLSLPHLKIMEQTIAEAIKTAGFKE